MPIYYTVDSERRLIFEKWDQTITEADVREYWFRTLEDSRFTAIRRILVDMRGARLEITADEFWQLMLEVAVPYIGSLRWAIATVVDSRAQYELSRQYQVFIKAYGRDAIFHDRNIALDWLLKQDVRPEGPAAGQVSRR